MFALGAHSREQGDRMPRRELIVRPAPALQCDAVISKPRPSPINISNANALPAKRHATERFLRCWDRYPMRSLLPGSFADHTMLNPTMSLGPGAEVTKHRPPVPRSASFGRQGFARPRAEETPRGLMDCWTLGYTAPWSPPYLESGPLALDGVSPS